MEGLIFGILRYGTKIFIPATRAYRALYTRARYTPGFCKFNSSIILHSSIMLNHFKNFYIAIYLFIFSFVTDL